MRRALACRVIGLGLAGLGLVGLTGGCRAPDPAAAVRSTTWHAADMGGRGIAAGVASTLHLDAHGRASGTTGCNRFTGPVSIAGDEVRLGPFASTRRMCAPPVMDQEERYLEALAGARHFRLEDGTLRLQDAQGRELVRFVSTVTPE